MPRDLICLMCPNGCHLVSRDLNSGGFEVEGYRCEKGLAFAQRVLGTGQPGAGVRVTGKEARPAYSRDILSEVAAAWGISFKAVCPDLIPEGSPERTLYRVVIQDESERLFVLEQLPPASFHAKMRIIKALDFLAQRRMPGVIPYLPDLSGQFIRQHAGGSWQVVPFCPGVRLDRGTYLYEGWRGEALARFLIGLREKSEGMTFFSLDEPFSLKKYIFRLLGQIERHRASVLEPARSVAGFLEKGLMRAHDGLAVSFCHGDFHPLNIVWGKSDINAAIDWEFLGMKPEIYDAANMVGCLGMEHPSSLCGALTVNFIRRLKEAGIYSAASWEHFHGFVVAMRFAWLSEWLRKDDNEMISLELDYMRLLIDEREAIVSNWDFPAETAAIAPMQDLP